MTSDANAARHDKQVCGARRRGDGEPCQRPAGWGTDHPGIGRCKLHGGSTPGHKQAAIIEQARRDVTAFGGRLDVTPPEALLELVQAKAAEVAYWDARVAELTDEQRAGLLVAELRDAQSDQGDTRQATRRAGAHVFIELLHKAQDQLATYSTSALKVGINQALVQLAVSQGHAYIEFGRRVAIAAGVPADQINDILRQALEETSA